MNACDVFEYHVESGNALERLDVYVAAHHSEISRSQAAILIRRGDIVVDGKVCKPGYRLNCGEIVTGCLAAPEPTDLIAEAMALDIVFEDRDLLVINKAAGMVVHPAPGHHSGTLVHGILHHCPDLEGLGGEKRPGIVHRLDKDTSGLLVVAKNAAAHKIMAGQFKARTVKKQYLALVHGLPETSHGKIDLPIGRHPVDRKRMTVMDNGRAALSLWRVIEPFTVATLLSVAIKTGRTHQIRVHCQAAGYPIVGDAVYVRRGLIKALAASHPLQYPIIKSAKRQMLHAHKLSFSHPRSGERHFFEAPLPEDMADLIERLREL